MNKITQIQRVLENSAATSKEKAARFFKTGSGEYAEHDQFIGVSVPFLRQIAKKFSSLPLKELKLLIESKINEYRLLALFILVKQYQKGSLPEKERVYQFYLDHLQHVNNWNLVDSSAHHIAGAYLWDKDRSQLLVLANSKSLWERRIAIVSTWYFIREKDTKWTYRLAEMFLGDREDLIQKASGWMLRECGKQKMEELLSFLDKHAEKMPRTTLRYAIEKLPEDMRKAYLMKG